MRPVSISSAIAPSRGWSRCAVKKRTTRLILGCIVVVLHRFLRVLAEQPVVEHLARDRRRGARAEAGVLDDDRDRDLRVIRRGVRDEQRVIAEALRDAALDVFLTFQADDLRRAGLAAARVLRACESAR